MPNPKASSTGYNFYYSMVNLLGEDGALDYFDALERNVYQFTSSGGAPASALARGEAGVGLSLVFELVNERNDGAPTELDLFGEGVPWTMNGISVVKGHDDRQAVWDVMGSFLYAFPPSFLMLYDVLRYENCQVYDAADIMGIPKASQFVRVTPPLPGKAARLHAVRHVHAHRHGLRRAHHGGRQVHDAVRAHVPGGHRTSQL